jgi:hypothetical protein
MITEYRGSDHIAVVSVFSFPFTGELKNTDLVVLSCNPALDGAAVVRNGQVVFKGAKTTEVSLQLQDYLETAVLE